MADPPLEQLVEALALVVAGLDRSVLSGKESLRLCCLFARAERLCVAGKALCAAEVSSSGAYRSEGARDGASWLAEVSGEDLSAARDLLAVGAASCELPGLDRALRSGELSGRQARQVERAASVDPAAEDELLREARAGSLRSLREAADEVIAAGRQAADQERRHAEVHRGRHLRTWTSDGAFCGRFQLTAEQGVLLMGPVELLAGEIFSEAWRKGRREPREAYLADALVALGAGVCPAGSAGGSAGSGSAGAGSAGSGSVSAGSAGEPAPLAPSHPAPAGSPPPPPPGARRRFEADYTVILRCDLEALVRGHLAPGEECSIDGTGPVPVSVVQSYLDRAKVRLVVERSEEISSVVSFKRSIPRSLDIALRHRDRTCVVPGCSSRFMLERDHLHEFAKGGRTALENLCLLCPAHHAEKSTRGFRIEGGSGHWRWLRPDGTVVRSADPGPPDPPPTPSRPGATGLAASALARR